MHLLTSRKCSGCSTSRSGLPGVWESENAALKLHTAAVLGFPCFLHYSLASSSPLPRHAPLCLPCLGFCCWWFHVLHAFLRVEHCASPQRWWASLLWALAVGGNSWLDVVVLNCSSCCSVEFRCTPVRVSFSYWAGNSSPLSSNLFYYNRWLLIVPPIMKSWLNTLC